MCSLPFFAKAISGDRNYGCILEQGACHIVALPFALKNILKQNKIKFKYSTMQKYNLKISSIINQNPSRYYMFKFKFQHKPKYHLKKIFI
jgi:hypothetical protein